MFQNANYIKNNLCPRRTGDLQSIISAAAVCKPMLRSVQSQSHIPQIMDIAQRETKEEEVRRETRYREAQFRNDLQLADEAAEWVEGWEAFREEELDRYAAQGVEVTEDMEWGISATYAMLHPRPVRAVVWRFPVEKEIMQLRIPMAPGGPVLSCVGKWDVRSRFVRSLYFLTREVVELD